MKYKRSGIITEKIRCYMRVSACRCRIVENDMLDRKLHQTFRISPAGKKLQTLDCSMQIRFHQSSNRIY